MRRRLRSARALPDTVINGARFSPHLILLLSELSGPKTIINSQSSVNPPNTIIPPHPPPTTTSPTPHHLSDEEKWKRDGVRDREVCVSEGESDGNGGSAMQGFIVGYANDGVTAF